MSKYLFIPFLFLLFACSPTLTSNDATVWFAQNQYNFGSLAFKEEAECSFEFFNPGETPLIIYDVKTTCGCTAANWTKTPIRPGKSGIISVIYDSAFPGVFHKEVSVFYNGLDSPAKLEIKGQVEYPDGLKAEK